MITAHQIMAGELPTTKRTFDVESIGKIELHRLPSDKESEGKKALALAAKGEDNKAVDDLENFILNSIYYMLHGEFEKAKSKVKTKSLRSKLDDNQISKLFSTGLYFMDLSPDNKEQTEKN